jgi:hypothetical protein
MQRLLSVIPRNIVVHLGRDADAFVPKSVNWRRKDASVPMWPLFLSEAIKSTA